MKKRNAPPSKEDLKHMPPVDGLVVKMSEGFEAAVKRAKRRKKFKPIHVRGVRD